MSKLREESTNQVQYFDIFLTAENNANTVVAFFKGLFCKIVTEVTVDVATFTRRMQYVLVNGCVAYDEA